MNSNFAEEHSGARIAVVWRDLGVTARVAPATTAQFGSGKPLIPHSGARLPSPPSLNGL
jgi:hypothetical protein